MSSSIKEIKAHLETKKAEVNQASRVIQKAWLGRKFNLPAPFDGCMAYFTGYKSTNLIIDSAEEFLSLAGKCADYCNRLQDKESLQLLMYAVVRRVYDKTPYGFDFGLLILLDCIQGDTKGVYQNDRVNQIGDTTAIFKVLLRHIESDLKENVNFKPLLKDARTQPAKNKAPIWHELFQIQRNPDQAIPFTRGGGFYNFLDMQKGIMPGMKDDSGTLDGIYVTPENRTQRDQYYANAPGRCRHFLDKPSIQSGSIAAKHLKSTNYNHYEALIETQNFSEIKDPKIQVSKTAYLDWNCYFFKNDFFVRLKTNHLVNSDIKRLERLSMIEEISSTEDNRVEVRLELLTKNNLNPVLNGYINQLKSLCQKYKEHLNDYPNLEMMRVIERLESTLTLDETKPLIRELKNFAKEINANKQLFCSLEKTFPTFLHDVFVLVARTGSFNYLASNSSMLFFSGRAQSFINETSKIADEAINQFSKAASKLL